MPPLSKLSKLPKADLIFEIMRFVLVGSLATLVDLTVTLILFYLVEGISENLVTTAAFSVAFLVSYFGHRKVTFKKEGNIFKFLALALSMLALRNVIVYVLVSYVIGGMWALIIAMALVTIITFVISKFFVFKG